MILKSVAFSMALIFTAINSRAQTLNDVIYLSFTSFPPTNYRSQSGSFQSTLWELNAGAPPVQIGKSIKWFNSLYYRSTNMSFEDGGSHEQHYPTQLNDIRYSSVFRIELHNRFELVVIPRVLIRSDLQQSFNENDLFTQAVLLGTYAVKGNPNFRVGLGMALNNDFERNAIIPIGSLYYDSRKFKAEGVYPNAHFLYKLSAKTEFGLFTSVDGSISRVHSFIQEGKEVHYFGNFHLLIAPTISHQLFQKIYGHLKLGFSPVRYYETLDSEFKEVKHQRPELENGLFIRAGISFRIKNQGYENHQ